MEGLNTLGTFFQKELAGETFPQELLAGEIAHLTVNRQERLVRVEARFPAFVEYGDLQRLSKVLEGPALGLPCVRLEPRFPAESFSAQCVPSLVAAVKELDACLNGTFKQAEANLNGSTLSISLAHGGYDLLAARGTGEKLQGLIQAWFGVACQVEFTGKRTVAQGEESLIQRVRTQEVKRQREAAIQEMEQYEESPTAPLPTIAMRSIAMLAPYARLVPWSRLPV